MRCFVAIKLPENVRSQIYATFQKLEESRTCFGNFVPPENLHLTLKFLGDIPEDKVNEVNKVLERIDFRKFTIETGKVGFFPNKKFVKTVWVELVSPDIEDLKKIIDSALSPLGFEIDSKKFVSHVTVARLRNVKNKEEFFEKAFEVTPQKMFFIAEEFSLMKSEIGEEGPKYETLRDYGMRIRG